MMDFNAKPKGGTSAKGGVDVMAGHRKRQSQGVSLRDKARQKKLAENRGKHTISEAAYVRTLPDNLQDPTQYDPNIDPEVIPNEVLPLCCQGIREMPDLSVKAKCCHLLGRLLRKTQVSLVMDDLKTQDIIPSVQKCCNPNSNHPRELVKAAITLMALMATGDELNSYVLSAGSAMYFAHYLNDEDPEVRSQAMSGLASLITSVESRDLMRPWMDSVMQRLQNETDEECLSQVAFFWTQFAKIKEYLPVEWYAPVLPRLTELANHQNMKVSIEAAWCLSYISDGDKRMPAVATEGLIFRAADLLRNNRVDVKVPALRLIGNFCSGDDEIADCVLRTKVFDEVPALLQHTSVKVRKETVWMLSNIAAGPDEQVSWLLGTGYVQLCTPSLSAEYTVRKEAIWVFKNLADVATPEMLWYLIDTCKFLPPFIATLDSPDKRMVLPILDSIGYLFHTGEKIAEQCGDENPILKLLYNERIEEKLHGLMAHSDAKVSKDAEEVFWMLNDEEDDDDLVRNGNYANQFYDDEYGEYSHGNGGGDGDNNNNNNNQHHQDPSSNDGW